MEQADRERLRGLLAEGQVGSLSVMVEGRPYVSLVPFVLTADGPGVVVHVSRLARHSAGLERGAPWALLVHEPVGLEANPQRLARVTLQGHCRHLEHGTERWVAARDLYLGKYPKSAVTFRLGDFSLIHLSVESGRFIAGFASTWNLSPEEFGRLAASSGPAAPGEST